MGEKRLLLAGSGGEIFRKYALEAISRRASILSLMNKDLIRQAPYISEYVKVDPRDPAALADAARPLEPDGVLTYYEQLVEPAAQLAASLRIPHTAPVAIQRCRDKGAMRDYLNRAGISPVRHGVAASADEAADVAGSLGYPVVVKPRALGGSIGVVRIDNKRELAAAFRVAVEATADHGSVSRHPGVLIEELLDGPEFSVDCVTWESVTHPPGRRREDAGLRALLRGDRAYGAGSPAGRYARCDSNGGRRAPGHRARPENRTNSRRSRRRHEHSPASPGR